MANGLGMALPLLAFLLAVPVLLSNLGAERFGALSLVLAAVGYAGTLDAGIASAVTWRLSALAERPDAAWLQSTVLHKSMQVVVALGLLVALLGAASARAIVGLLEHEAASAIELIPALWVAAGCVPFIFAANSLAAALAARGEFVRINAARTPCNILMYLGPAVSSVWSSDLVLASAVIAGSRVLLAAAHWLQCRRILPRSPLHARAVEDVEAFPLMARYAAWLTVSSIVGPLMVYMDRFVLGALRSVSDVASYVPPAELAIKLTLVPAALLPVVFPALVATRHGSGRLTLQACVGTAIACSIPAAVLATAAAPLLSAWLRVPLGAWQVPVMQILVGAALVNCVAQGFVVTVQATGRTDLIAKVHIAELMFYVPLVWLLAQSWGGVGVAVAWALRVALDACMFCWLACRGLSANVVRGCWWVFGTTCIFGALLAAQSILHWSAAALALLLPLALIWPARRFITESWRDGFHVQ